MSLYVKGVPVPPLGSPRDKVLRNYLANESRIEMKRQELQVLIALATPQFDNNSSGRNAWDTEVYRVHRSLSLMMLGYQGDEYEKDRAQSDKEMIDFYVKNIQGRNISINKAENGKLTASGVYEMLGVRAPTKSKIPL